MNLSLEGVSVDLGGARILTGIDLVAGGKGVTAILGPNGSGKTTLLRTLAGLVPPSGGTIRAEGREIANTSGPDPLLRGRVTLLHQEPVLLGGNVGDEVARPTRFSGGQIDPGHIIEGCGLSGIMDKNVARLSNGERRRTALARAFAVGADLVLLDEPTAGLDEGSKGIITDFLALERNERGIVIATHDHILARRLDAVTALLDGGRLHAPRPRNIFFGRFLGEGEGEGAFMTTSGAEIFVTEGRPGDTAVEIEPEDIVVTRDLSPSSARNRFEGTIERIRPAVGGAYLVIKGPLDLEARITLRSISEMGLDEGTKVGILFKASSVRSSR